MLFNSFEFLFVFLPLALGGYFFIGRRWHPGSILWLLACSLFFYAWWRIEFLGLLLGSTAANYIVGQWLIRNRQTGKPTKHVLLLGIVGNLALLGYYKYASFFVANLCALADTRCPMIQVLLPLGISFFTFTQIAYLVDSARGRASISGLAGYGLFVTYFPHLLAGPILHHREMISQFVDSSLSKPNADNIARGLVLLILGLAKKVLIADEISPWANSGWDGLQHGISTADAWITALAYTFQIYFDFSGYTDMAIGMSLLFNIRLPENFCSPYRSTNIRDFWRRWHMTLSRFLRDYLYVPLGGNRNHHVQAMAAVLVVFLLGGLWHGANWTFVAWGALNGLAIIAYRLWAWTRISLPVGAAWLLTFVFTNVAWVIFRAPNIDAALQMLTIMVGLGGNGMLPALPLWAPLFTGATYTPHGLATNFESVQTAAVMVLAAVVALIFPVRAASFAAKVRLVWPVGLSAALIGTLAILNLNRIREFLYFNF